MVLGLPLANYFPPELMAKRIFGFTLTRFFLGIGFFRRWVHLVLFIKRSIALENEEVAKSWGTKGERGKGEGEVPPDEALDKITHHWQLDVYAFDGGGDVFV